MRRVVHRALLVILVVGTSAHARAQDERVVDAVAVGDPSRLDALEVIVRDLLAGDAFTLRWSSSEESLVTSDVLGPRPADSRVLARAWIDLTDATRWRLYMADARGERFLVRVLDRGASSDEVLAETLGHILAATLRAIASGLDIGTDRSNAEQELHVAMGASAAIDETPDPVATEPVAPEPVTLEPVPASSGPELRVGAFHEGALVEESPLVQHGPGLSFAIASGPASHASVLVGTLTAQWLVPLDWARGAYGARFDGAAFRALASYEAHVDAAIALEAAAGLGVDLLRFAPRSDPSATPLPPRWIALPIARAALGIVLRFGALLVPIRVGCDFDLSGTHYTASTGDTTVAILSPWIPRPFAQLGVSFAWQ